VRFLACPPVSGLAALVAAYRRLRHLLPAAQSQSGASQLLWEMELAVDGLLSGLGETARERYIVPVLGTLLREPERRKSQLLRTLETLEATHGGLASAAAQLNVHPKTLQYRLRRVGELTGLNPQVPADRFRLQLAVHVLRLSGQASDGWFQP
jgi:DNA-binding PucR family transcriptional regulator